MIDKNYLDDLEADASRILQDPSDLNNAADLAREVIKLIKELRVLPYFDNTMPSENPFYQWIDTHKDSITKIEESYIAIHPILGIVASGPSLGDVSSQVKDDPYLHNQVLITRTDACI